MPQARVMLSNSPFSTIFQLFKQQSKIDVFSAVTLMNFKSLQTTWKRPATDKALGCSFKPVIVFAHLSTNSETRQQNTPASFYSTENHIWVINPGDYSRLKLDATCCHFRTAAVGVNTTHRLLHRSTFRKQHHPANRPLSFYYYGDGVKLCNACSNASFILTTLTYGINILLS